MHIKKFMLVLVLGLLAGGATLRAAERSDLGNWYVSPGIGVMFFESDHPAKMAPAVSLRVGQIVDELISWEVGLLAAPHVSNDKSVDHTVWFNRASIYGITGDMLFHFGREQRLDPYLSVGLAYLRSDDRLMPAQRHGAVAGRFGLGAQAHLNDLLALRGDLGVMAPLSGGEIDLIPMLSIGLTYRFGGEVAPVAAQPAGQLPGEGWYVSPSIGMITFERDNPAKKGAYGALRIGHDLTDRMALEVGVMAAPQLHNDRSNDELVYFNKASLYGVSCDLLMYMTDWACFDPYVTVGLGYLRSDDRLMPGRQHGAFGPRLGVGTMLRLYENFALRADMLAMTVVNEGQLELWPAVECGMVFHF